MRDFSAHYVRFGSEADITRSPSHVRFTPESGHGADISGCPLCAKSGLIHRSKRHPHSITLSARASNLSGTWRPSAPLSGASIVNPGVLEFAGLTGPRQVPQDAEFPP